MKLRESYTCPLELVHDMIKGKWKTIIIFQLRNGKCSFSELHHSIAGITQKMLSAIKIMQEIGIDYMVGHGMTEILDEKGICYEPLPYVRKSK